MGAPAVLQSSRLEPRPCERLYRRLRPRFVLGTGGYASFPAAQVAAWHGARLFWQEQNAEPGQVTRRLGAKCERIFAGFPDMDAQLPGANVVYTGNPVRRMATGDRWRGREAGGFAANDLVLLVLGGSGGAASINRAVARIADCLRIKGNLRIWWQTGRREFEDWRTQIAPELFPGTICAFIEGMADAYAAADFVVARAGAMTTAEICAAGKPAVLVPFPYAASGSPDTQRGDAGVCRARRCAWTTRNWRERNWLETFLTLAGDATQQARLAAAASAWAVPGRTAEIVDVLEAYL